MRKALLVLVLLLSGWGFGANAQSLSVGRFECNHCLLEGPVPDFETLTFIKSTVNQGVASWWDTASQRGRTVTICNATHCAVYTYQANGNYLQTSHVPNIVWVLDEITGNWTPEDPFGWGVGDPFEMCYTTSVRICTGPVEPTETTGPDANCTTGFVMQCD